MKLKSVVLFSVAIVLLTTLAFATPDVKKYDLKFKGDGYFAVTYEFDEDGNLVSMLFSPPGGYDLLNVSHLGLSQVAWELRVTLAFQFIDGWFTITGANGRDGLMGDYSGFVMGVGEYDLEWDFTGGTGRFEDATGTGHTDGLVDLSTGYAEFEFFGSIIVPKNKGKK
jgi:hypothetical protein